MFLSLCLFVFLCVYSYGCVFSGVYVHWSVCIYARAIIHSGIMACESICIVVLNVRVYKYMFFVCRRQQQANYDSQVRKCALDD